MDNQSIWLATTPTTNYPTLEKDLEVDVAVIGGGIAGLNAAYFLMKQGLKVAVLEAGKIIAGTSGNTTAKVTSLHGLRYFYLTQNLGKDKAKIYGDSNQWAISELEKIIKQENIECDFYQTPSFTYTKSKDDLQKIKQEVEAAINLGLPASFVTLIPGSDLQILGAIRFENQAYFHPRKYLLKIAEIINGNGSSIYENTPLTDIKEEENSCEVKTLKANVKAKHVIIATNMPFFDPDKVFAKLPRMGSFVIASQAQSSFPEAMFIGTQGQEMSFRPHKDEENKWLIIGERHDEMEGGDMNKSFQRLSEMAKETFQAEDIDYKWGAVDTYSLDNVPYIGRMPGQKNIFVTTGFSGWGMTTSLVSAKLLTDLIIGNKDEWVGLYDPKRLGSPPKLTL